MSNSPTIHSSLKRGSHAGASQILKLTAWGVLSGGMLCGLIGAGAVEESGARQNSAPEQTADAPTATVLTTPAAPTEMADAATPLVGKPAAMAPTTAPGATEVPPTTTPAMTTVPLVITPEPTTPSPAAPSSSTTGPAISQPATPTAAAPAPAAPDASTPAKPVFQTVMSQPAVLPPATRPAAEPIVNQGVGPNGSITIMAGRSDLLTTRVPYKRVSIGQPDIADVNLIAPSQVLLTAKKAGSTQLIIWDDQDHSQIIDVIVSFDLKGLESQLKAIFPRAAITAESANGAVVLRGHIPDLQTAQQVTEVATPYGTSVLNFMEVSGGQQVILQVRFAEVQRSITQRLGFNAFATDGKFNFGINEGSGASPAGSLAGPGGPSALNLAGNTTGVGSTTPLFGSAKAGNASFEFFLDALRQNGLLRMLAEPNVIAISGQQASFLAGGEIPIPVPQPGSGGSAITIEYKQYGVQLNFTPTILGDGRVRLQCAPQVSQLDYTNTVTISGNVVPGLTTRNVSTTVELAEGQTFALAGLIQNNVTASKSLTPVLGDLPILGALFRSVSYQRNDTELVVLVTPRLVEPMNPNQVPRAPGDPWRDPTEAELFMNTDLGGPAPDRRHIPTSRNGRFYGATGFRPATPTPAVSPEK